MSYPKNQETIVIQNEFYPDGIFEIDIWNYYQKAKRTILKETLGRDVILFIAVDVNKFVIKRKAKDRPYIMLNPSNYDEVITGRTLSVHSVMRKIEDFGVIDIDTDDFQKARNAAADVYDVIIRAPFVKTAHIRFTGKSSFHIICEYKRKLYIDRGKELLEQFIRSSHLIRNYTMTSKRKPGFVNLDLYRNVYHAGFITLGSLSEIGLMSMEVPERYLNSFTKQKAIIRTKK